MVHEKPNDLTPEEAWSWREAEFCDRMVETLQKSAQDWVVKSFHSSRVEGALRSAIAAECWDQMAAHLRMPIYIARENRR